MKITLLTGKTFDFSKEFSFDIKVKKSVVAKKLVLRIDEKNRCAVLSIPKYCLKKQALNFLKENEDWIINTLAKLPRLSNFTNGDEISVFGKTYKVLSLTYEPTESISALFSQNDLVIIKLLFSKYVSSYTFNPLLFNLKSLFV